MLQQTVARITSLLPPENILVVAGENHGEEVHNQLAELPKENIILEPVGRNTAACIGLAALVVQQRDSAAVMAVLPADHLIADEEIFLATLRAAVARARLQPVLITLGIRATTAETGYGYIEAGEQVPFTRNQTVNALRSIWNRAIFSGTAECLFGKQRLFLQQCKIICPGFTQISKNCSPFLARVNLRMELLVFILIWSPFPSTME
jgi:hypothetical protein